MSMSDLEKLEKAIVRFHEMYDEISMNTSYRNVEYAEQTVERNAMRIRKNTPSIPDIDLERYLCPECGKRVRRFKEACTCGQLIDWGFYK